MATTRERSKTVAKEQKLPPLEPGDHLDQATFHARYEQMPEDVKAELIGGIVYMPAALRMPHGRHHGLLMGWLTQYFAATPGIDFADNTTVLFDESCEPQPDACLFIPGGQAHENEDGYLVGPPELVAEIASSSEAYDLHSKRDDYERFGVQEYLVVVVRSEQIVWLNRQGDRFVDLPPGDDGVFRSSWFPGLWLDPVAFFRRDARRLLDVLNEGIATAEHTRFVEQLAASES
jgi:Uma2 family endonuclease